MIWSAGIDVGGTNLKAVAVSTKGVVLQHASIGSHGTSGSTARWSEQARAMIDDFARVLGKPAACIGVCAPGLVSSDGRSIAHLPGKLAGLQGIDWTNALGHATI